MLFEKILETIHNLRNGDNKKLGKYKTKIINNHKNETAPLRFYVFVIGRDCVYIRGCQMSKQGPQLCVKPCHFCKLVVATSRMALLDLNLSHQIQTIEGAL